LSPSDYQPLIVDHRVCVLCLLLPPGTLALFSIRKDPDKHAFHGYFPSDNTSLQRLNITQKFTNIGKFTLLVHTKPNPNYNPTLFT